MISFVVPVMMSLISYALLDVWSHVMLMSIFRHSSERLCCFYSRLFIRDGSCFLLSSHDIDELTDIFLQILMRINYNNNNKIDRHLDKMF